jgi:drug/metabolite transporter (DMT)-like permease
MSSTGPITSASPAAYIARFANPVIIGGVLALIARYIFQLSLLSWADLTYAIPITSVSYIVITAVGAWVLREEVSAAHWFGVVLILFGVIIVSRTKPLTGRAGAL